jgi:peptidoglycan/LPS O-acetylase OafA/YrhL
MATSAHVSPKHSPGSAKQQTRFAVLELVKEKTGAAAEHLFVNNVRFLCMAAVVFMHSVSAVAPLTGRPATGWFVWCMEQPAKFGSIGFFLISGFLMGEGLTRSSPLDYLMRRMRKVLLPWAPWYLLCFALMLATDVLSGQALSHAGTGHFGMGRFGAGALLVLKDLFRGMFGTAYWFVPNLLLGLCVLLLFRRYIQDIRLGFAMAAVSLAYGASLYVRWLPMKNHTQALLGFVFYLWLGAWVARNRGTVDAWMERTSMRAIVLLAALAGIAAVGESWLIANGNASTSNLRISNQVYSVAIVLAIFKLRKAIQPRVVNARATTFGVYLSHWIVLWLVMDGARALMVRVTGAGARPTGLAAAVGLSILMFALIYGCSLGLTSWLLTVPRLSWLVGSEEAGRTPRSGKDQRPQTRQAEVSAVIAAYQQEPMQT